jgi:nucleotide-binding universal stress UspA family protein
VNDRLDDASLEVRTKLAAGDAASENVRHAERVSADLIAPATHGRSGIDRWIHSADRRQSPSTGGGRRHRRP